MIKRNHRGCTQGPQLQLALLLAFSFLATQPSQLNVVEAVGTSQDVASKVIFPPSSTLTNLTNLESNLKQGSILVCTVDGFLHNLDARTGSHIFTI